MRTDFVFDESSLLLACPTETPLKTIEAACAERSLTLGYLPATRVRTLQEALQRHVSNRLAERYGEIDDLCVSLAIRKNGQIFRTKNVPRSATGPDFKKLLCAINRFGIGIEASLRLSPKPETIAVFDIAWDKQEPLAFLKLFWGSGIRPAFFEMTKKSTLQVRLEGLSDIVDAEIETLRSMVRETGERFMRDPEDATSLCQFCPKLCRHACPVADAEQSERSTPNGKMTAMKLVEENKLPMDRETMGLAYKCLNCRASESACELDNPVSQSLNTYRVRAFRAGLTPGGVESYCEKFQKNNNPYSKDLLKILKKKFPERLKESQTASTLGAQRTAYFPGCTEIVKSPGTIEKTLSLLDGVGLFAEPIQCCGYPLFAAGDWESFAELAEVNSHALREYDQIITGAPACLYTMETLYRSAGQGVPTQFQHVAEYLADGRELRVEKQKSPTVAYHDPCYLGRYRNTYDAPRDMIRQKTGKAPVEFVRHHESSACCGAGGLLPVSFPETAEKITRSRVEEFKKTGADLLVTSCPTCVHRFRKFGVPTKGLIDFLSDSPDSKRSK